MACLTLWRKKHVEAGYGIENEAIQITGLNTALKTGSGTSK
jgi:hypothetical protein